MLIATLGIVSATLSPLLSAEEQGLTPKATRPPLSSPRNSKPLPSPDTKPAPTASPAQKNNNASTAKPKWEYVIDQEGMSFIVAGKKNGALDAKIGLRGVNGWELVTVYNEGGERIFIYKRQM